MTSWNMARPSVSVLGSAALALVTWVAVGARLIPGVGLDRGIFVSVAERLRAGDRLYADVWDNKDPFFYLLGALGRQISPYADVAIEIVWVLTACISVMAIARSAGLNLPRRIVVGFAATPLVLTGPLYWAGYTELPSVALTLATFAAALNRRFFVAGVLVGLVAVFKLVVFPIGLSLLVAALLLRKQRHAYLSASAGIFCLAVSAITLLQLRGELIPYIDALSINRDYAQLALGETVLWPPLEHLSRVFPVNFSAALVCLLTIATVAIWALLETSSQGVKKISHSLPRLLALASVMSSVLAAAILSLMGLWPHHGQILYVPALIGLIAVASSAPIFTGSGGLLPPVLLLIISIMLGGALAPEVYWRAQLNAEQTLRSLSMEPVEAAELLSIGESGTYARIGQNDDGGHAYGLMGWTLACPRFHQYFTDSSESLDNTLDCLADVDVVLKSPTGREFPIAGTLRYNNFISDVNSLLARDYDCGTSQKVYGLEVCRRTTD